jgi:hypothetical protein
MLKVQSRIWLQAPVEGNFNLEATTPSVIHAVVTIDCGSTEGNTLLTQLLLGCKNFDDMWTIAQSMQQLGMCEITPEYENKITQ